MNKRRQTDSSQRVVVTGIGMATPLGVGKEEFGRRLFAGETGIAEIKSFDTGSFPSHSGAEASPFNPRDFVSVKNMRRMDKISLMAASCAQAAGAVRHSQVTKHKLRFMAFQRLTRFLPRLRASRG